MEGLGLAVGIKNIVVEGTGNCRNRPGVSWHSLDRPVLASGRLQTARRTPDGRSNPSGVEAPPRCRRRWRHGDRLSPSAERYNAAIMLPVPPNSVPAVTAAVEALPFGVATTDAHGSITWANAAYSQLTGCTTDELLGQSAGEFPWDELANAPPSSEPWRNQAVCKRKTGETYSAEYSITTLRDAAEEVMGFWIMKRDATGPSRSAGVPHEAKGNLSALIESTSDLIVSVDLKYRLVTFNKALRDNIKSNVGLQAAVGMRLEEWLPPQRYALWPPMFDRALSEGPFRTEYSLLDGRTLELSFNPIRQDDRTVGVSVFGKDITERKAAEKGLREAESKYRNIFDGAVEGLYQTSLEGKPITGNLALAKMLGYESPEEAEIGRASC